MKKAKPPLFACIDKLYMARDTKWLAELDENSLTYNGRRISTHIFQLWLSMDNASLPIVAWLHQYAYDLPIKMYLALAWSVIPKRSIPPYLEFIGKKKEEDTYKELWEKVRKTLELSDHDFAHSKPYLLAEFEARRDEWFKLLGMDKKFFKKHGADYETMRAGGVKKGKSGLELF